MNSLDSAYSISSQRAPSLQLIDVVGTVEALKR